jgi:hypothetical protein
MYVHQEMLPYCWFPNGGYWVYQDTTRPGTLDSTYSIGSPVIDIIPDDYGLGYREQKFYSAYFFRGKGAGRSIAARAYGPNLEYSYSVMRESFDDASSTTRDEIFFWDKTNPDVFVSYPTTSVRQRLDSVLIQGKTYYDVIEVVTDPPSAAAHTFEAWWARDVGMVRRSMTDGTVWELVRHKLN